MPIKKMFVLATLTLGFTLGLLGCNDHQTTGIQNGQSLRPEGTNPTQVPLAANSIYLFEHDYFRGNVIRLENVTGQTPEAPQKVGPASDRSSSARWNLPPGVVVLLAEDAEGRGDQVALWGQGEAPSLVPWNFNDKISRYTWFNVGGSPALTQSPSARPPGAVPTGQVPPGVIELFADRGLQGRMTTLGPVMTQETGVRHPIGSANDRMTSLRWNLPSGIVVVFYEDVGGKGRQVALWGQGQYETVSTFDFNDKASRWAWYDVGRPTRPAMMNTNP